MNVCKCIIKFKILCKYLSANINFIHIYMCVCVCVLHLDLYHRKYSDFTKQKGLHTLFQPKKRNPQPLCAAATRSLKIARSPPFRQVHLVSVSSGFFQRANLRETMRANIKAIAWKLSANQVWLKKRAPLLVYVDQFFGQVIQVILTFISYQSHQWLWGAIVLSHSRIGLSL